MKKLFITIFTIFFLSLYSYAGNTNIVVEGIGNSEEAARKDARTQMLNEVPGTIKAFKVLDSFITHNELRAYLDENVSSSAYDIDREQNPTWSGVDGDATLTKVAY